MTTVRDAMAVGSYPVLSHKHHVGDKSIVRCLVEKYRDTRAPVCYRNPGEERRVLRRAQLIGPGLVPLPELRPEPRPIPLQSCGAWAGRA